jgi:hypothetical protein
LFACSICRIFVTRGKCGKRHSGGLSYAIVIRHSCCTYSVDCYRRRLTTVYADFGSIRFNVIKAGFVVGGSGGSGTLIFHGRRYPISIGGVSYGFTFGASSTDFVGEVSNIRTPFDINGVYGAAGAGIAVGPGAGGIALVNQNGAVLTLSGRQVGLIVAADLNGLVITLR